MAVFQCKMCGGSIDLKHGTSIGVCEYCGTKQTFPRLASDTIANLYDRANHYRRSNDYDKAMSIYEQILNEDTTDAEAYWSLVLCRYGIEYVEDPATHKRVPTVNRTQTTPVFADEDYKAALRYADDAQKEIYEAEARTIDEIQKGILLISQNEKPFDVFICYKETDADGRRTQDSVLAYELYDQLNKEGYKTFFARITLEDKLGTAYEPYIYAALNSAKVMVVLGTKPEYFHAVWVKNEWSRFLVMTKKDSDKVLIPAYRDMSAYDLPEEFSHLQALDMSKLGFMQDLIHGIKKMVSRRKTTASTAESGNDELYLKRAFLFLSEENWNNAYAYCEKVLDRNPQCAEAYLGELMFENRVRDPKDLQNCPVPLDGSNSYQNAIQFGSPSLVEMLESSNQAIKDRIAEQERMAYEELHKNTVGRKICFGLFFAWMVVALFFLYKNLATIEDFSFLPAFPSWTITPYKNHKLSPLFWAAFPIVYAFVEGIISKGCKNRCTETNIIAIVVLVFQCVGQIVVQVYAYPSTPIFSIVVAFLLTFVLETVAGLYINYKFHDSIS